MKKLVMVMMMGSALTLTTPFEAEAVDVGSLFSSAKKQAKSAAKGAAKLAKKGAKTAKELGQSGYEAAKEGFGMAKDLYNSPVGQMASAAAKPYINEAQKAALGIAHDIGNAVGVSEAMVDAVVSKAGDLVLRQLSSNSTEDMDLSNDMVEPPEEQSESEPYYSDDDYYNSDVY